ncbi:MAG: elongation factor P maturation arginine rhamnosyltransferase EarP [Burkholderiaceae bacterium]|nr:elongation factor P maturation arginine rhamnosyltransferase EarP [Burkholderiaceae bacterium]
MRSVRWTLFCRVIDNLGDAGVCWRLAADLAGRGETVQLVIDDASPLHRIAPRGTPGVDVIAWSDALDFEGAEVVIEAFGCNPPERYVEQMAKTIPPPRWINLEYLSAEPHAQRSHALPSPQWQGPGRGLTKWFYYPGFTAATGGLLREPGLLRARAAFDRDAWLRAAHVVRGAHERVSVLFSYAQPGLGAWLSALGAEPTLLLVPQGPAQAEVQAALGPAMQSGALRAQLLPWLTQVDFDRLLWSSDLSVVRGEDSLVRALWAGAPFVWQLYPQHDGAHLRKLLAFLARWRADSPAAPPAGIDAWFQWWNGVGAAPPALPALEGWRDAVHGWRDHLAAQPDLGSRLLGFVASKR